MTPNEGVDCAIWARRERQRRPSPSPSSLATPVPSARAAYNTARSSGWVCRLAARAIHRFAGGAGPTRRLHRDASCCCASCIALLRHDLTCQRLVRLQQLLDVLLDALCLDLQAVLVRLREGNGARKVSALWQRKARQRAAVASTLTQHCAAAASTAALYAACLQLLQLLVAVGDRVAQLLHERRLGLVHEAASAKRGRSMRRGAAPVPARCVALHARSADALVGVARVGQRLQLRQREDAALPLLVARPPLHRNLPRPPGTARVSCAPAGDAALQVFPAARACRGSGRLRGAQHARGGVARGGARLLQLAARLDVRLLQLAELRRRLALGHATSHVRGARAAAAAGEATDTRLRCTLHASGLLMRASTTGCDKGAGRARNGHGAGGARLPSRRASLPVQRLLQRALQHALASTSGGR